MSMKKVGKRKAVAEAEASAPLNEHEESVNEHEDVQNGTFQLRTGVMAFYKRLKKKPWITEGKFLPSPTVQNGNLADQIKSRGWEQLVTNHIMPCREVVLEFLANLSADPEADEVQVRGIMVSFTPVEINRVYNLRDFDHANFDQLEASPNFDMIVAEMCSPGTTWSKPGNINSGSYFPGASLNRVAKAWMLFIASNLLPYTKPHLVTRRRAVLLYCICSGGSINIGRLLNTNIKRVTTDGKVLSICHGSLITQLCKRAGVSIDAQEARMGLGKAITDASIEKVKPWVGGSEDPNGLGFRDHQAPAPATARAHAQGEARRKNRADVRAASVESSSSGSATLVAQMQAMELGYNARFDELQHSNTTVLRSNDALGQSFNSLGAWQAEFGERCILEHNYRRAMDTARIEREMARIHVHQQDYSQSPFTPYPEPPARLSEPFPRYVPYDGPYYEPPRAAPYPAPFPSPATYPNMAEPYYGTDDYMPEPPSPFVYQDAGARVSMLDGFRKLLILDMNGVLVHVTDKWVPQNFTGFRLVSNKKVFKRPHADDFLEFCLSKFDVAIWSSRVMKNLKEVLKMFPSIDRKTKFVWDQFYCDSIYDTSNRRPIFYKKLTKVWETFEQYNETNTLLVDDCPKKASFNPANTGIFPPSYEYTMANDDISLGPGGELRNYLDRLAMSDDIREFVRINQFGQPE